RAGADGALSRIEEKTAAIERQRRLPSPRAQAFEVEVLARALEGLGPVAEPSRARALAARLGRLAVTRLPGQRADRARAVAEAARWVGPLVAPDDGSKLAAALGETSGRAETADELESAAGMLSCLAPRLEPSEAGRLAEALARRAEKSASRRA